MDTHFSSLDLVQNVRYAAHHEEKRIREAEEKKKAQRAQSQALTCSTCNRRFRAIIFVMSSKKSNTSHAYKKLVFKK